MNTVTTGSEAALREALKRCPPATYEAARRYRATGDPSELPVVIRGVIERYVERERHAQLHAGGPDLRLIEDLGIDSLTMMEIVMLAEEALPLSISNEELRHLRTLGEVEQFIASKLRGGESSRASSLPRKPSEAVGLAGPRDVSFSGRQGTSAPQIRSAPHKATAPRRRRPAAQSRHACATPRRACLPAPHDASSRAPRRSESLRQRPTPIVEGDR